MSVPNETTNAFLAFIQSTDILLKLSWDTYMEIMAPFPTTNYSIREVTARYRRNGYDWDIHGRLYIPTESVNSQITVLMLHGGGVNELSFDKALNGRPGWARVIASQGYKVLSVSYPGQWPPDGIWKKPVKERTPIFLFDREIKSNELQDRVLKYTFNLVVEGIAILADRYVPGNRLLVFGHSLGGRLVVDVWRFTKKTKVVGILGFGSLGPQIWIEELQERIRKKRGELKPVVEKPTFEQLTRFRRVMTSAREPRIYLPITRSIAELEECAKITELSREEYLDNTLAKSPDRT